MTRCQSGRYVVQPTTPTTIYQLSKISNSHTVPYIFVRRTFRSNPNSSAATHARVRLSLRHLMVNSRNPMAKAEIKAMITNLPCFGNNGGLPFVTISRNRPPIGDHCSKQELKHDQETYLRIGNEFLLNFFSGKGTIGPCYGHAITSVTKPRMSLYKRSGSN